MTFKIHQQVHENTTLQEEFFFKSSANPTANGRPISWQYSNHMGLCTASCFAGESQVAKGHDGKGLRKDA